MKKHLVAIFLAIVVVIAVPFFASDAQALIFSDTLNFVGDIAPTYGYSYFRVFDNAGFSWLHDINDNLSGHSIADVILQSAVLNVTFANTNDDPQEHWQLTGLGPLVTALGNAPNIQLFNINLADLGDGLFTVIPFETTNSLDRFRLISSTLSGTFDLRSNPAIPEPTTLLLMVSVLGAGFLRRTKAAV